MAKRTITDEAKELALGYGWPGNVRELENIIKRVLVLTSDSVITRETLIEAAPHLEGRGRKEQESFDQIITDELNFLIEAGGADSQGHIHDKIIRKVEKPLIEAVLRITGGNKERPRYSINRNTLSKDGRAGTRGKRQRLVLRSSSYSGLLYAPPFLAACSACFVPADPLPSTFCRA
jgi:two-component system nitrogen regulation response regulator GlnG